MNTVTTGVTTTPVSMENRQSIGIRAGDTVKVHQRIQDKGKTRIQIFEGIVLARKHGNEPGATFTVRKMASGVGVEKIFPLYSPNIDKIEIVKRSKVRRAKLYFIRDKVAREIKRQMRRMHLVTMATESAAEAEQREAEKAKKAEEEKISTESAPEVSEETVEEVKETEVDDSITEVAENISEVETTEEKDSPLEGDTEKEEMKEDGIKESNESDSKDDEEKKE